MNTKEPISEAGKKDIQINKQPHRNFMATEEQP